MAILRLDPEDRLPYFQVARATAQDASLSWEARGLLSYLHSLPADWRVQPTELVSHGPGGEDRMYRMIRELKEAGYVVAQDIRDEKGRRVDYEYLVRMRPNKALCPDPGKPDLAEPDLGKPELTDKTVEDRSGRQDRQRQQPSAHKPLSNVRELKEANRARLARKGVAERLLKEYVEQLGHVPRGARSTKPFLDSLLELLEDGYPLALLRSALDQCDENPWELKAKAWALKGAQTAERPRYANDFRIEDQFVEPDPEVVAANLARVMAKAKARAERKEAEGRPLTDVELRALGRSPEVGA